MSDTRTGAEEPARDVLAAEMFGMPAPDPDLHHHGSVQLPSDPTGIEEPHDVLAAEEFPMPAPRSGAHVSAGTRAPSRAPTRLAVAVLLLIAVVLRRRLRARP